MLTNKEETLKRALSGDIHAFQELFADFQEQLKSYLFRLTANRNDAEDLTHDCFIKAFDKLGQFRGEASLKTWVFQIATNLAKNFLQRRSRWTVDVSSQAKELVLNRPQLAQQIEKTSTASPYGQYDIREHIDTCFTCISKTLAIENQVTLILKDIYDFSVREIMIILDKTEGAVKYLLQTARKTMTHIFDRRCALVNKNGTCHQCSELNGWLNPRQNQQAALMKIKMARNREKSDQRALYQLRTALVKSIDPLRSDGHEMQELLMRCNRMAMGEET
ncbi:MAG: sigma-70 family RNA polymerase sigma factor [Bacteroidota bacterium]